MDSRDASSGVDSRGAKVDSSGGFSKGCAVSHKIFGLGVVQEVRRQGGQEYLRINFGGNIRLILADFVQRV